MVSKRPVRPSKASSDSDDPLDVIGPSAPSSPPQSRHRSTPARPPPSGIKRTTPSAKYTPRQQVSDDDEDLPKSGSRSSFAKRRRVLSDSEEEPEVRDGSPKNLARFVADPPGREGDARDQRNGSDAQIGSGDAGEASVSRPELRKVELSESEEEDAGSASKPTSLPDEEDAFGLFTADRSSSPAQNQTVTDVVPVDDAQHVSTTERAAGGVTSNDAVEAPVEEVEEALEQVDRDQAANDRLSGIDEDPATGQVVGGHIGINGEGVSQDENNESSETYPDKTESFSMEVPGSSHDTPTADTISATVDMGGAMSTHGSGGVPLDASETIRICAQEIAVREEDVEIPVPTGERAPSILDAGIEADSAPHDEMDSMQNTEDKANVETAEGADVGPVLDPMESSITMVAVAEDQPVEVGDDNGVADDGQMEVSPAPEVSSKELSIVVATTDEATYNTGSTTALRPIFPQTPQSMSKLPSLAALQPTSSLSTLPDPSPASSPSLQQKVSVTKAERTASESVPADEAEGEEEQEEGEEEIDPEDIEMEEEEPEPEAEPESKPSKSSKSSASEIALHRDKSENTPTAAESRDIPAPAPVLLNSKGLPRGKPGRKPGWKVGDPLIKERKAMEARAKLGLDKEEEKKPVKGGKKGKVEALKSAARGRSVSFSETSEPAGLAADSKSVVSEADENGDDDDTIYCFCGKSSRADGNDTLVGCDGCDSWFHAGCVGLSEDEIELVDTFFCANCEKATGQKTTMKRVCKRSGCDKQFSNRQSKFCSSACAFQHSQTLIASMQNKKQLQQLSSALAHYPPPPPDIRIVQHLSSPPNTSTLNTRLYNPVEDLERRITETQNAIDNLEKRILISGQAIEACETLPPLVLPNGDESGKKKRKPGGGDDRPCGWVEALIWADEEVGNWESGMPILSRQETNGEDVELNPADEVGGDYCMNPRKRCDRHSGWRTIIPESFGKELSQAQVLLASLVVEKNNLVEMDNAQKAGKIARDSLHELLALRLAKTVV